MAAEQSPLDPLSPPYLTRLRIGLGVVILTSTLVFAASLVRALVAGVSPFSTPEAPKMDVSEVVGILAIMVGWWIFASPAPGGARRALNWTVRLAALCLAGLTIAGAFLVPTTGPEMVTQRVALGASSWIVGGVLFYATLVLIYRVGTKMGNMPIRSGSVLCMIGPPVLVVGGAAFMMFLVTQVMASALIEMTGANGGQVSSSEGPPLWLFFLPASAMILATVWYLGFLARAWIHLMRWEQNPQPLAAAY